MQETESEAVAARLPEKREYVSSFVIGEPDKIRETFVRFMPWDNTGRRVCFPEREGGRKLDMHNLRSLAMLGAAVTLIAEGEPAFKKKWWNGQWDVPMWIRDEVDRLIGTEERDARD